jgi:hypothetical protein
MQLAVDFKSERVVELERMALNDWWDFLASCNNE